MKYDDNGDFDTEIFYRNPIQLLKENHQKGSMAFNFCGNKIKVSPTQCKLDQGGKCKHSSKRMLVSRDVNGLKSKSNAKCEMLNAKCTVLGGPAGKNSLQRVALWSLGQYSSPPPHSIFRAAGVQPGVVSTSSNPISQFSELQGNGVFCNTRECSAGECSIL